MRKYIVKRNTSTIYCTSSIRSLKNVKIIRS
uniref:Uncharacterized protein n=1 Tax=Arundo donax TaxID=35708 RepID=A0A0A9CPP0_ARUDO